MEIYHSDGQEEAEEQALHEETFDSSEEAFMKGYMDEEKVRECTECGAALQPDSIVARVIDGEEMFFCSETCADEFEDSIDES